MKEIISSAKFRPINVTWELTLECNLNCKHCGSAAGMYRKNELSLEEALKLCKDLKSLGTQEVTLIGGEPFISKHWFEIAKTLAKLKIKVNFVTNGTIMSKAIIKKLKKIKVNNVGLSIDGKRKTNDLIRGKGTFIKIIKTIKTLQKNKIPISIATTVSKYNFKELKDIYKELLKLKTKVWQIQLAMPVGRMPKEFMLELKNLRKLINFIIKVREENKLRIFPGCNIGYFGGLEEKYRIQKEEKSLPFWTGCYSGIFEMGIMSNGSIKGCLAMKDKFIEGNIQKTPLKKIWEKKTVFSYNRKIKLKGYCAKCEYGTICRGGCPVISEALTGLTNNDPMCLEKIEN